MKLLHNIRSNHVSFLVLYSLISLSFSSQAFAQIAKKAVDTKSPEYVNVTEKTKNRIAEIQKKSPQFLIEDEVLACIKGELIDSECEATAVAVADAGESMIKIEAKNRELALRKDELLKKDKALDEKIQKLQLQSKFHTRIATGLVQLLLSIEKLPVPTDQSNVIDQVIEDSNTPADVLVIFKEMTDRMKKGETFVWEKDASRILSLHEKYINLAKMDEERIPSSNQEKKNLKQSIDLAASFIDYALDEIMKATKEEKQALAKIKIIGEHCIIVTGLVQLALYVDYDQTPSSDANAMIQVTTNKNTPKEVLALFDAFLTRKKNGRSFTWKNDVERIMDMASKYLEIANQLETSIKIPEIKKNTILLIKATTFFYENSRKRLIIKH